MARNPIQFQLSLSLPAGRVSLSSMAAKGSAERLSFGDAGRSRGFTCLDCGHSRPCLLGNLKTAIAGTYHGTRGPNAPRYLAEFEYHFNRRYNLNAMMPHFLTVAARTSPMPYWFMKTGKPYA